jgi:glycosyltransferase involved in cell wall biosynthesis
MDGYSFLVRAHNEQETLETSVRSLFGVLVAYEILIFLNNCTDASKAIAHNLAKENNRVKVFSYDYVLSRPGYETLATDSHSNHSISTFYNWSLKHSKYKWRVKWDADFVATQPFIDFLNNNDLSAEKIFRFGAKSLDGITEHNDYMSSCLREYRKDVFWESPGYKWGCEKQTLNITFDHVSSLNILKSYWYRKGWYEMENSEEAAQVKYRVQKLYKDFGQEPMGLVRSENMKAAISYGERIIRASPDYVEDH